MVAQFAGMLLEAFSIRLTAFLRFCVADFIPQAANLCFPGVWRVEVQLAAVLRTVVKYAVRGCLISPIFVGKVFETYIYIYLI